MLVGLPIALWLGHIGRGGFLAINISNIGRAIPTFALLAVLRDGRLAGRRRASGPTAGPGMATLIALGLFALPPLITNAYVAVREVPDDIKEAAIGMGMSGSQRFWRVELPLAMPLVMSGVRLALVQVWATATIAALVAGPGVGRIIVDGFARNLYSQGIAGGGRGGGRGADPGGLRGRAVQRAVDPVPREPRRTERDARRRSVGGWSYAVAHGGVSRRTGHARDAPAGHRR